MNRRFIAPFLAVDVSGSLDGGVYAPGSPALSGKDTAAGTGFAAGMGPATDAPWPAVAVALPAPNPSILAAYRTGVRSG